MFGIKAHLTISTAVLSNETYYSDPFVHCFRCIEPVTLTVEGSNFDVRVNGTRAEAIRTNMQYASRMGPMGDRAYVAIEKVSGCIVKRFVGDQAVIVAELDC